MAQGSLQASTLELRLSPEAKSKLQEAARVAQRSVSEFVLDSALERAGEVLSGQSRFGLEVESVPHMTPLNPLDFRSQIDELRTLKDGWYDGKGRAPSSDGLDWLAGTFEECYPDGLDRPHVYPNAEGGVRFEWQFGRRDVSLEIDVDRHSGEWHSLDLDTDDEEVRTLILNDRIAWEWMAGRLQTLRGDAA